MGLHLLLYLIAFNCILGDIFGVLGVDDGYWIEDEINDRFLIEPNSNNISSLIENFDSHFSKALPCKAILFNEKSNVPIKWLKCVPIPLNGMQNLKNHFTIQEYHEFLHQRLLMPLLEIFNF